MEPIYPIYLKYFWLEYINPSKSDTMSTEEFKVLFLMYINPKSPLRHRFKYGGMYNGLTIISDDAFKKSIDSLIKYSNDGNSDNIISYNNLNKTLMKFGNPDNKYLIEYDFHFLWNSGENLINYEVSNLIVLICIIYWISELPYFFWKIPVDLTNGEYIISLSNKSDVPFSLVYKVDNNIKIYDIKYDELNTNIMFSKLEVINMIKKIIENKIKDI